MNKLTKVEKAYIAGIIDGEGCISISKHKRKNHYKYIYYISISNTNKTLIDYLRSITQLGMIRRKKKVNKHKLCYEWFLRVNEIKQLLPKITPYLIVRKRQAFLMMEFLKTITEAGTHNPNNPLSMEISNFRAAVISEISVLNRRGVKEDSLQDISRITNANSRNAVSDRQQVV